MSKSLFPLFIFVLIVLTSCSHDNENELSGKSYNVSYRPVLKEDLTDLTKYGHLMNLDFANNSSVIITSRDVDGVEGSYELNNGVLVINFSNENTEILMRFGPLEQGMNKISQYSTVIENVDIKYKNEKKDFYNFSNRIQEELTIDFINK